MKTAIVTFVRAYNHGAVLQCYALHKKLNDLGIDNEVLDYYPEYFRKVYNLDTINSIRRFPASKVKRIPKLLQMRRVLLKRNCGFERFIKKNIRLSPQKYYDKRDVYQAQMPYQAYIVGSDQVWHHKITERDPVFFLDFPAAQKAKKLTYAASFGVNHIPEGLVDEYKQRLTGWDAYSVREKSGVGILADLLAVQAEQCCDPTLLLQSSEWEKVMKKVKEKTPYILVYHVNMCEKLLAAAQQLASQKGLKIISIASASRYDQLMGNCVGAYPVEHHGEASPDYFLGLFYGAEYVLTDSFHGTVFSLIFHKRFSVQTDYGWMKNNRINDLLTFLGIENRKLECEDTLVENDLPWNQIDNRIQEYRNQSIQYLREVVKYR